jgi:integrase
VSPSPTTPLTLGRYGVLTLTEARDLARRALVEVAGGIDPQEERRAPKSQTVRQFSETYMERHAKVRLKSWADDSRRFKREIVPKLGSKSLESVKRSHVADLHSKIGRKTPYEANRVLELVKRMFSLAEQWGYVPEGHPNPAKGIKRFREKSRDRFVTEAEFPLLRDAINAEQDIYVRSAIWLCLFTGARKTEILSRKWEDVDLDRKEMRLKDTKAGRDHVVPLSQPALEILGSIPRQQGNPYVFPGRKRGEPRKDFRPQWDQIRERAGLQDITFHDLRRTVGSWLALGGSSLVLIGKVLNHSSPSTTKIYARLLDDAARDPLEELAQQFLNSDDHG